MANDGRKIATNCLLSFIAIGLLGTIAYYLQMSQNANSSMDLSSVTQIKDDWMLAPLTEISTTEDKYCPAGMNSIWTKLWGGTVQGCDCTNVWNMSAWKHQLQIDDRCMDDDEYQCYYEPPRSPIVQQEFDDVWICGRRDGTPFAQAVRPSTNSTCPSGTSPCSINTSKENTYCYRTSEGKAKCPITGIQFVNKNSATAWLINKNATNTTGPREIWEQVAGEIDG